ncbi:MAG: hypothetical protein H0V81_14410 [Solirubrobacterales bacterium]|nr:hypothetical protein [Solirubrobacterales bacterium]
MTLPLAATAPPSSLPPAGDGAPLADIALVGGIISAATAVLLAVVIAYRRGGARPLRQIGELLERMFGIPGWAAIPGLAALGAAVLTFGGAIWDIGVHIDEGRDTGPFGTTAHYPLLVGLVLTYLMGILAVGMAPRSPGRQSRAGIELPGLGRIPVGALLILTGGGFAMLGFPLDDLWHRIFGQDVTLWGPTHTMFFGGLITAACGAVILMAEGARVEGREPFGAAPAWRRPLAAILGGIFLFVAVHATDEFNWAVPQYRQVWQPLLLMFFGGFGLILTRALGGRGATIGTLAVFLPLQLGEVVLIGALGTTQPASVLFVVEALVIELVWFRAASTSTLRKGALAGLAVGTVGFAAEYGWSQFAMPLPWRPALLVEGIPTAALAGLGGGVLAVLLAKALTGTLRDVTRPLPVALGTAAMVLALCVNAAISTTPPVDATLSLSNVREGPSDGGGRTQVADLEVRLSRPDLAVDGNWIHVLGWQGGGRHEARLIRRPDGSLRSSRPVPIGGTWKTFVRLHKGRTQVAVPIRMPADAPLDFAGFAAPVDGPVTRPLLRDSKLLQIERKDDGPFWAWTPAMLFVMALNLALMSLVAAGAVRSGRVAAAGDDASPPGAASPPDGAVRPAVAGARTPELAG